MPKINSPVLGAQLTAPVASPEKTCIKKSCFRSLDWDCCLAQAVRAARMVELNVETASSGGSPRQSLPGSPRQSLRGYRPDAQSPRPSPERKRKQASRAVAQARADQRAAQEELRVTSAELIIGGWVHVCISKL